MTIGSRYNLWPALVSLVLSGLLVQGLRAVAPPAAPAHAATAPAVREKASADQTIQIKLKDLLDAVPRRTAEQILARLSRIEERLTAIEAKLPPVVPAPAVDPLGTRK